MLRRPMGTKPGLVPAGVLLLIWTGFCGRPMDTDDAGTVVQGKFEFEMGYDLYEEGVYVQDLGFVLSHGISSRMELGMCFPMGLVPETGMGSAELVLKSALFGQNGFMPAVSVSFAYEPGSAEYDINGIMTRDWEAVLLHLNCGYHSTSDLFNDGNMTFAGAIDFLVREDLHLVIDLPGETDFDEFRMTGAAGGHFLAAPPLILDAAVSTGLLNSDLGWQLRCGFTWEF